ncbi:hypothetical protein ABTP22_19065, partial [Acinetobacter baumannii]
SPSRKWLRRYGPTNDDREWLVEAWRLQTDFKTIATHTPYAFHLIDFSIIRARQLGGYRLSQWTSSLPAAARGHYVYKSRSGSVHVPSPD